MSKPKGPTLQAVSVAQIDEYLSESYLLTIVDGQVTQVDKLAKAPDLMSRIIGTASRALWQLAGKNKPL